MSPRLTADLRVVARLLDGRGAKAASAGPARDGRPARRSRRAP